MHPTPHTPDDAAETDTPPVDFMPTDHRLRNFVMVPIQLYNQMARCFYGLGPREHERGKPIPIPATRPPARENPEADTMSRAPQVAFGLPPGYVPVNESPAAPAGKTP